MFTLLGPARTYRQRRNRRVAGVVLVTLAMLSIAALVVLDRRRSGAAAVEWTGPVAGGHEAGPALDSVSPPVAGGSSDARVGSADGLPGDHPTPVVSADLPLAQPRAPAPGADGFDFSPESYARIGAALDGLGAPSAPSSYDFGPGFSEFFAGQGAAAEPPPDPFAWMDLNPEPGAGTDEPALHGPPTPDP